MPMKVSFCWFLFLVVFIVYIERSKTNIKQSILRRHSSIYTLTVDDVICTLNLPWKLLIGNTKDFY